MKNDLKISELITQINLKSACLNTWFRDQKEHRLFTELMEIETAAKKAMERLNELRFGKGFVPPEELMGQ